MFIGGLFGHAPVAPVSPTLPEPELVAGSTYYPTSGQTYRLQSTIGSAQTTLTLTSFKEPVSNIPYTMSYLNSSIEYGTLSPQTSVSEFISFTGITQNTNGTATLTGVVRGLARSYPYTASTTLAQPHSGQSVFILSDAPQVFNQYVSKVNDQTISGLITFTQPPIGINPGGSPNSSETVNGLSQLATGLQSASSTSLGSTGARVIIPASLATSTRGNSTGVGNVVTLKNDGRIDPSFVDGTGAGNQYTFNATTTMSSAVIATTTITTLNATTANLGTINGRIGTITGLSIPQYTYATTTSMTAFNFTSTSTLLTIPAGLLTASSSITVQGGAVCQDQSTNAALCTISVKTSTGVTLGTINSPGRGISANGTNPNGNFVFTTVFANSLSSEVTNNTCSLVGVATPGGSANLYGCGAGGGSGEGGTTLATIDFSQAVTLMFVIKTNDANLILRTDGVTAIVNP